MPPPVEPPPETGYLSVIHTDRLLAGSLLLRSRGRATRPPAHRCRRLGHRARRARAVRHAGGRTVAWLRSGAQRPRQSPPGVPRPGVADRVRRPRGVGRLRHGRRGGTPSMGTRPRSRDHCRGRHLLRRPRRTVDQRSVARRGGRAVRDRGSRRLPRRRTGTLGRDRECCLVAREPSVPVPRPVDRDRRRIGRGRARRDHPERVARCGRPRSRGCSVRAPVLRLTWRTSFDSRKRRRPWPGSASRRSRST